MSVPATAEQELEHTDITKAASSLSQCTTLAGDSSAEELCPEISAIKPDVENALELQPECHAISIWTLKSMGIVIGGFLLAFLNAICSAVPYGFFLGYMGLDSYVISSITQLMQLPHVLLLPFGLSHGLLPDSGQAQEALFRGIMVPRRLCSSCHGFKAIACSLLLPERGWQLQLYGPSMQPEHPHREELVRFLVVHPDSRHPAWHRGR